MANLVEGDRPPGGGDWFAEQPEFREWQAQQQANQANQQQQQAQVQQQAQTQFSPQVRDSFLQGWRDSSNAATPEALRAYAASKGGGHFSVINDNGKDKLRDSQGRIYDVIGKVGTSKAQKRTGYTTDKRYAGVTGSTAKKPVVSAQPLPRPGVQMNSGGGLQPAQTTTGPAAGTAPSGNVSGVSMPTAPTLQQATASQFTYRPMEASQIGQLGYNAMQAPEAYQGDRQVAPEAFGYEAYQAPDAFNAPTAEEAANDPGYQFGLQQSQKALQNQAASRGILQSKNFVAGMSDLNRQAAQQQYGDVYGRRLGEYNIGNANNFQANQANNAGRLGAYNVNTANQLGVNSENYARGATENQQGFQNAFAVNQANNAGQNATIQGNNQNALALNQQQYQQGIGAHALNTGNQMQATDMNNQNALGLYGAQTNAALGLGNLNLGYQNSNNQYALGNRGLDLGFQNSAQDYALGQGNLRLGQAQAANSLRLGLGNLGVAQGQLGLATQGQNFNQGLSTYDRNYAANVTNPWTQYYQMAQLGRPTVPD